MVQFMEVSLEARGELERMARSSVLPHRKVVQATALLELADGASVRSTARLLRTYPNTVAAWRDRFIEAGVGGVGVIADRQAKRCSLDSPSENTKRSPSWPQGCRTGPSHGR